MPNQPRPGNPARAVRVEDELWDEAMSIARERGENLSEHVIRPALDRYVKRHRRLTGTQPTAAPPPRTG